MLSSGRRFTPSMPPFLFHKIVFVSAYLRLLHCLRNKILVECEADTNWNYAESRWPNDSSEQQPIMRSTKIGNSKCLKIPSAECCHTPAAAHDISTCSTKKETTTSSNQATHPISAWRSQLDQVRLSTISTIDHEMVDENCQTIESRKRIHRTRHNSFRAAMIALRPRVNKSMRTLLADAVKHFSLIITSSGYVDIVVFVVIPFIIGLASFTDIFICPILSAYTQYIVVPCVCVCAREIE